MNDRLKLPDVETDYDKKKPRYGSLEEIMLTETLIGGAAGDAKTATPEKEIVNDTESFDNTEFIKDTTAETIEKEFIMPSVDDEVRNNGSYGFDSVKKRGYENETAKRMEPEAGEEELEAREEVERKEGDREREGTGNVESESFKGEFVRRHIFRQLSANMIEQQSADDDLGSRAITAPTRIRRKTRQVKHSVNLAKKTARTLVNTIHKVAKKTAQAIKYIVRAIKAIISLFTGPISGIVISVLIGIIAIAAIVAAIFGMFASDSGESNASLSDEVLAYTPIIRIYAEEYEIPEFVGILQAIMMQESGGRGSDPMQCSESGFNTRYPRTRNGITDPEYSIQVGVQTFADCLNRAGCETPYDFDTLYLAIQGYNYGSGYISWALSNYGGYSRENAQEYSAVQASRLGWSGYGDPNYVEHVMRYYQYGSATGTIGLGIYVWPSNNSNLVTSFFGTRVHPVHGDVRHHNGIDIAAAAGTDVLAAAGGTVTYAGWMSGYGNTVIIDHGNGNKTLYAHANALTVRVGQIVQQGQVIAYVGMTGTATGYHIHFETYVNGARVDPLLYYDNYRIR